MKSKKAPRRAAAQPNTKSPRASGAPRRSHASSGRQGNRPGWAHESLVFGLHAVTTLLARHPEQVRQLLVQKGREDERMQTVLRLAQDAGIACHVCDKETLDAGIEGVHQGVVALCRPLEAGNEQALDQRLAEVAREGRMPLLLVLDGVTDPHNFGACLRSADAAGVDAIVVPKDKAAPLNATVRKVACGAAEALPVIAVTNLARTLRQLADQGMWVVGTAGEADQLVYEVDLNRPLVMVMGAEGKGMRRLTREHCDELIKLPMAGEVSSLNVSVAAGVCLYEVVRQRIACQVKR
ncbi:23S rRNA (guanosine(2251)-2'-O)-methyltransferase RlmB [Terasakiispira papahanaumokuakeensis]|uniref:23S rRNA (guanosine(2251)-2'-O)-methyltransferase RlmB n=1 Tax=Terasakiispira papahanaumokuakeensis TaxID=197479 RepID=UPI000A0432E9|nr:23S rRNA (guanosine(2251)-2'-O)-methyltransferase RlmB [Terasakiispira papahanaumokuakeensis]